MPASDDRPLLLAAATGDRLAMDELVQRHAPLVLAACRRQLPGADADEAAQAVFVVLWRRAARAAAAPTLAGWLVVTAQRVCATSRRAALRRRRAERASMPPVAPEILPNEARALLDQALAALPAVEREAVVQRHLLGHDPAAVAVILACAEGTVHSRTSRGLERLRAWFARRGIVCPTAALVCLCAHEHAAAEALPTSAIVACAIPSATAHGLATSTSASPIILYGVLLMSFAALAVTAILVLAPAAVTTGGEAPAATARATHVKIYDIEDLAGNEVPILNHSMVTGVQVEGEKPPPPDWENVAALDASRTLDRFCSLIQSRAGSSSRIRLVDVGLTDEDFQEYFDSSDPVAVRKRAREVRSSLSHTLGPVFPGMDVSRSLLVDTDSSGHRRIDVDLRAVRRQREERLKADTGLMAASEAFCRIVDTIFPPGWYLPKTTADPPIVQAQLPATLPTANGRRFAIIWLPEVRHPGPVLNHKPIAVATDGTCSLIATTGWIRWRPDIRPAAIALFLRQHLDRGEFRGPLTHEHWLAAAQFILSDKTAELDRDLAELLSFHK